ncbi:MAG: hypothetical protein JXN63_01005 [Candidatus Delongbacteria bacterium]|nr:hypothetical protein [Candidatus Delongbacteria bacterium]
MKNDHCEKDILLNCDRKLSGMALRKCAGRFFSDISLYTLILSSFTALVVIIEISYRFDTSGRKILFFMFMASLSVFTAALIKTAVNYYGKYTYQKRSVISEIDKNYRNMKLLMLYDLVRIGRTNDIAAAAVEDIYGHFRANAEIPGFFDMKSRKSEYKRLFISFVLFSIILFSGTAGSAFDRIVKYKSDFSLPPSHSLHIGKTELYIPESDTLEIICSSSGSVPEIVTLKKVITQSGNELSSIIANDGSDRFVFREPAVNDLICFFESEETRSDTCRVVVLKRPHADELYARLKSPAYTRLEVKEYDRSFTEITGYKGSVLSLNLKSDPLGADSVLVVFKTGERILMEKNSETEFSSNIRLKSGSEFHFSLYRSTFEGNTLTNLSPVIHKLEVLNDEYPFINLIYPEDGMLLKEDMNIPVFATGTDDFEVSRIELHMRKVSFNRFTGRSEKSDYVVRRLENAGDKEGVSVVNSYEPCSGLNLLPEDKVELFLRIFDNDDISGPKYTDSQVRTVILPSIEQLLTKTEKNYEEQDKILNSELERNKDILESIDDISEKLKKNRELNWEDKNRLDQILQEQEKMKRNLEDLESEIEKNISMLDENSVLSDETMKKYMKLQQLVDEMFSKDIKEKLKDLSELSNDEKFDKASYAELLKDFEKNQQKFRNDLEKTIEILEQIKNEYLLDKLLKQLDLMISEQNEINLDLTEFSAQEMLKKEASVEKSFEFFKKELQSSSESMEGLGIDSVKQKAEEIDLEENFSEIRSQMYSSEFTEARKTGNEISSKLLDIKEDIEGIKNKMMDEEKEKLVKELNSVISDLIAVSDELENIKNFSKDIPSDSGHASKLIRDYARIGSSLETAAVKIFEISKRTFFIDKTVIAQIGRIEELFRSTSVVFNNRQFSFTYETNAVLMGSINNLAVMLNEAIEELRSAESPSGLEEMLKKMEEMARKQAELNSKTSQSMSSSQGAGMTQMQEMMNRLAQEQAQLYDALMKMQSGMKSPGEQGEPGSEGAPGDGIEGQQGNAGSGSPGNSGARGNSGTPVSGENGTPSAQGNGLGKKLGNIGSDMKEIEDQLKDKRLDESLLSKQDRVLEKLLDAVESLKREKLDNKRESRTGDLRALDPGKINIKNENDLKEMLIRTLKDGYSNEYKIKIKKYFRQLEN